MMSQETVKYPVCDELFYSHTVHTSPPAFDNDTKNFDLQFLFSRNAQKECTCVTTMKSFLL